MAEVMLALRETQVLELASQLSPEGKRALLRVLIPDVAQFEGLVNYGDARIRALCKRKGIDWDSLTEEQRERLIDDLLHETLTRPSPPSARGGAA
jgi:hypothetical protein